MIGAPYTASSFFTSLQYRLAIATLATTKSKQLALNGMPNTEAGACLFDCGPHGSCASNVGLCIASAPEHALISGAVVPSVVLAARSNVRLELIKALDSVFEEWKSVNPDAAATGLPSSSQFVDCLQAARQASMLQVRDGIVVMKVGKCHSTCLGLCRNKICRWFCNWHSDC